MSGQCVPFISVSPVISTVPGTEQLSVNVCEVQAGEKPLPPRVPCAQLYPGDVMAGLHIRLPHLTGVIRGQET